MNRTLIYVNPNKYYAGSMPSNGTDTDVIELLPMLHFCKHNLDVPYEDIEKIKKLSKDDQKKSFDKIKRKYGCVFPYIESKTGIKETSYSGGYLFIDIDNISKESAEAIFNIFDTLNMYFPYVKAITYSSSFYMYPEKKCGVHIYICTNKLDKLQYIEAATYAAAYLALFFQKNNISLESVNGDDVLDEHNFELSQRFFMFHSDFQYNEQIGQEIAYSPDIFSDEQKKMLRENFPYLFKKLDSKHISGNIKYFGNSISDYSVNKNAFTNKICVDKNCQVGPYNGNDLRGRISRELRSLFGSELAKQICDKYFYCSHGSIYNEWKDTKDTDGNIIKAHSKVVVDWLCDLGIIKQNKTFKYISEKQDEIEANIHKYNKLACNSPTGSGKTSLVNGRPGVIGLAKKFNAVVIVPFLYTRELYNNLHLVKGSDIFVPDDEPCVMTYDQCVKRWDSIKNRHIFVDECHELFFGRTYRPACIELYELLKGEDVKVFYISATPAGEVNIVNKYLEYKINKDNINLTIKKSINVEYDMYFAIKNGLQYYDRVIVFTNRCAEKLYGKLLEEVNEEDVLYFRSDTSENADVEKLRQHELLTKKITISTCVGYNGLNFKNESENILVVGDIFQGETTGHTIVQQLGRVRNSKVTGIYFYVEQDVCSPDKRQLINSIYKQMVENGDICVHYDKNWLEEKFVQAQKEIYEFNKYYGEINNILSYLEETGYIIGKYISDCDDEHYKMNNKIKLNESNTLKKAIEDGTFLTDQQKCGDMLYEDMRYGLDWSIYINKLMRKYDDVNLEFFQLIIFRGSPKKQMDSILSDVRDIIRVCGMTESDFKFWKKNVPIYIEKLKQLGDDKYVKRYIEKTNKLKKYRELFGKYIIGKKYKYKVDDVNLFSGDDIAKIYLISVEEDAANQKKGNAKGGKIGSPYKPVIVTDDLPKDKLKKFKLTVGQKFKSCTALAQYCQKNNTKRKTTNKTVSDWLLRGYVLPA